MSIDSSCWLLSPPHVGMAVQCRALAEAMGLEGQRKQIEPRWPYTRLPLGLWFRPLAAAGPGGDAVAEPWPDVLISCGRYAAGVARAVRRGSGGRTFCVQIQDPKISPKHFDVVIVPEHDRLRGENVLVMHGSLHRVTPQRLAAEAARFAPMLASLPRPLVAVLIGGPNRAYRLGVPEATRIADQLVELSQREGAGLAITISRRTAAEAFEAVRSRLAHAHVPHVLWDGEGENPYFGYLGSADYILVTCDSVNMNCEASATGKPVYVIDLPGGSAKFDRFHQQMRSDGRTRPFTGKIEPYTPNPLQEMDAVAAEVWRRYEAWRAHP